MRRFERAMEVPASVAAGAAQMVDHIVNKSVVIEGTFSATVAVEGRISAQSSTWIQVGSVTAPGLIAVDPLFYDVRIKTTVFTSGAPVARLVGLDSRTT